jgi:hypothetical protein
LRKPTSNDFVSRGHKCDPGTTDKAKHTKRVRSTRMDLKVVADVVAVGIPRNRYIGSYVVPRAACTSRREWGIAQRVGRTNAACTELDGLTFVPALIPVDRAAQMTEATGRGDWCPNC